ncbi:hypothetical protein [Bacillus sp. S14(2024)]|uniref:hypothetical protein n=1 Tax=Bacillus sp. S14(2024) TaxID=3162884 RepID=UPI003D22C072
MNKKRLGSQSHFKPYRIKENPQQEEEKELTTEQKLELLNKIAGSGRNFNPEHIEESLRIASRDEWE